MTYQHSQTGRIAAYVGAFFVVLLGLILVADPDEPLVVVVTGIACLLIFGLVWIFSRLTVTVESGMVTAAFGRGWPKRQIDLGTVRSVRQVRNHWFYGWGMRWVPHGWMYNVWGLDAVEFEFDSGRVFRIGTDEPEQLLAALEAART